MRHTIRISLLNQVKNVMTKKAIQRILSGKKVSINRTNNAQKSEKVVFTKMTTEEHLRTRVSVYPYLVP